LRCSDIDNLEFSLGTGGDGQILGWRYVLRTKYANRGASPSTGLPAIWTSNRP